jgi:glycosyltransferase involved in cell wall biosynthesis
MSRLRVTYVLEAPTWGGAEAYVLSLIELLAEEVEARVVAVEPVPSRLVSELDGLVQLQRAVGVRGKTDFAAIARLASVVRGTMPHLVHVNQNAPANNRYGILAAKLTRVPSVATLHLPLPLRSAPQRASLSLLYRCLDQVIVVSDEARAVLVGQLRVPRDRVVLIPNGVRPGAGTPKRASDQHGRPCVVGALGRLVTRKGLDVLVEAVRLLTQQNIPIELRIGGVGPEEDALRRQSVGLPIVFDGEISAANEWLRGLDLFCLPSRSEGLPLALLEAMMAGVPCIATDVGQVREALGAGVLLVPPADVPALVDALSDLCANPSRRDALATRGFQLARKNHSAHDMATSTAAVYTAVTERHRASFRRRGNRP